MDKYIFMSYAHKDDNIALPLFEEIAKHYNIWYDSSIEIGTEWPDYIGEKLYGCDTVMIMLSDNYVGSVNCVNEVNFALKHNKEVLVVYLHDNVKMTFGLDLQLGSKQAVFLSKYSTSAEFVKYLSSAQMIKNCKKDQSKQNPNDKIEPQKQKPRSKKQSGSLIVPLDALKPKRVGDSNFWEKRMIDTIIDTLDSFNLKVVYLETVAGPTVTRFEFQPERGVSLSKIQNYSADLALYLGVSNIRCICPIPGKQAFGIEVPNPKRSVVTIENLLSDKSFINGKGKLNVALGQSVTGENIFFDITNAPHMIVAGSAGAGKSVCINSIIVSLLYRMSPSELKLLLIDPKIIDLMPYDATPHLLAPVITDAYGAQAALKWAVNEMERRYALFVKNRMIKIEAYNEWARKNGNDAEVLPYIVIVINEYADLKQQLPRFDESIVKLAQKARAAGMHIIIATQRPSYEVLSGSLKANMPTRICFAVSSVVDSRVVLDESGAEKLLGKGDMLFKNPMQGELVRVQGPHVSEYEVEGIVGYIKSTYGEGTDNVIEAAQKSSEPESKEQEEDEKLYLALGCVCELGKATATALMKRLGISFARATRILSQLEKRGYISEQNGSKARRVLIDMDECKKIIMQRERQKK